MLYPRYDLESPHLRRQSQSLQKATPFPSRKTPVYVRIHLGRNFSQDLDSTNMDRINKSVSANKSLTKPALRGRFLTLAQTFGSSRTCLSPMVSEERLCQISQVVTARTSSDRHLHMSSSPRVCRPGLILPAPDNLPLKPPQGHYLLIKS